MNKKEKVFLSNNENEKLTGLKERPGFKKERYPALVLVHGFGVTKEEKGMFKELSPALTDAGFLVFRFDFSGRGESEGDYVKTSLSKMKGDLENIMNTVKSDEDVDIKNLGIFAQSLGTCVAVAANPEIKALVLAGSISSPKVQLMKGMKDRGVYDPEGISHRKTSEGKLVEVGPRFWKDFDRYELKEIIKEIHCPILFIHGENDRLVPLSEMEGLYVNANEPKEKVIIKDAGHDLRPNRKEAFKAVVAWFKRFLKE